MAFKLLVLLFLMNVVVDAIEKNSLPPSLLKLDPKKRTDLVDEAFLEQKDVLLDMLESKLKQVRDKKRRKSVDRTELNNGNGFGTELVRCDLLPKNVDLKLKANGIVAVGEVDVLLKLGNIGKGSLNMDAEGISNVGKSHLELGVNDGNVYIPGISNLFTGKLNLCSNGNNNYGVGAVEAEPPKLEYRLGQTVDNKSLETRRKGEANSPNATATTAATLNDTMTTSNDTTTSSPVTSTDGVTIIVNDSTTISTSVANVTTSLVDNTTQAEITTHNE